MKLTLFPQINKSSIYRLEARSLETQTINLFSMERRVRWRTIEVRNTKTIWVECKTWTISSLKLSNQWTWCPFRQTWMSIWAIHLKCQKEISIPSHIQIKRRLLKTIGMELVQITKFSKWYRPAIIPQKDRALLVAHPAKYWAWAWITQ